MPAGDGPAHPRPRRHRSIEALRRDLRRCRACLEAGYPITPPPVAGGDAGSAGRAYLLGLAPGTVEAVAGAPWQGRAGRALRRWLAMDEGTFTRTFTCGALTRCYPGKAASGRGDRLATPIERALCRPWWERELELLDPPLVVTLGGDAARALVGAERLTDAVGKSYLRGDAIVVPLPHPSGASGWLNDERNRARLGKAVTHVRRELARLGMA